MSDAKYSKLNIILLLLSVVMLLSQQERVQDPFSQKLKKVFDEKRLRYQVNDVAQERYLLDMMKHLVYGIKLITPDYKARRTSYFFEMEKHKRLLSTLIPDLQAVNVNPSIVIHAKDLKSEIDALLKKSVFSSKAERKASSVIKLLKQIKTKAEASSSYALEEKSLNSYFTTGFRSSQGQNDSGEASLLDIVSEWERKQIVDFQVQNDRLKLYQKRLLKYASQVEKLKIAKDLFRRALVRFNQANYEASAILIENIGQAYTFIRNKNQLNYYLGLSYYYQNKFNRAVQLLKPVLSSSKGDQLVALTLLKIYVNQNNFMAVRQVESKFSSLSSVRSVTNDFYFVLGRFYVSIQKFSNAEKALSKISSSYHLYNDARFLYAVSLYKKNKSESSRIFQSLVNKADITTDIRNEALLRLAYIDYQAKNYRKALSRFNEINPNDFHAYDKIVLGKAWCYYEIQMNRGRNAKRDFSKSIALLNEFLRVFSDSDYYNEAKSLLGYVKQKSGNSEGAQDEFSHVFEAKSYKLMSDRFLKEQDSLSRLKRRIANLEEKSLLKNDRSSFDRLGKVNYGVDKKLYRLKYMDVSSVSLNSSKDLSTVQRQVSEFERLREIAVQKKDEEIIKRIDGNLLRLYAVVNQYRKGADQSLFGVNYFREHKLARKVSLASHQEKKYADLSKKSKAQHAKFNTEIEKLKTRRAQSVKEKNFKQVADIDIALYRLEKAIKSVDYLNSLSTSYKAPKKDDNLDRWANYGAYQLTNIQYAEKEKIAAENAKNDETIKTIKKLMDERNVYLAEQIKQIENNIYAMTRRETRRRRIAERNKTKEFYETEFFDERKSEVNEDSIRFALEEKAKKRRLLRSKTKVTSLSPDSAANVSPLKTDLPEAKANEKQSEAVLDKEKTSAAKEEEN